MARDLDEARETPSIEPTLASDRITLRVAVPSDAGALARTARAFFTQTFGAANRPEDMDAYLADAFSEQRQRADLHDAEQRVWLALDQTGEIVGYAHVRHGAPGRSIELASNRAVEIARLYADPRWHGRGLGPSLMNACLGTAREWGADLLWLGVWEHNPRAIAFYEKHGFRAIGAQEFLLGADRQRDLVMALYLTTAS